ncbi:unnamed protein product [Nippostrongylus brasiliensis]|uniref:Hypotheticial protein n=1 Tax=Nippostrongylus brasiliensis TaxID=27835 RepID=A0A0N4YER5_NIPBR|nr:unnamed protein product [Nippostrongylus brasiliensis]
MKTAVQPGDLRASATAKTAKNTASIMLAKERCEDETMRAFLVVFVAILAIQVLQTVDARRRRGLSFFNDYFNDNDDYRQLNNYNRNNNNNNYYDDYMPWY